MSDTRVTLGDVTFASYEVPSKMPFGGEQQTIIHRLLGGARVIDSTGVDDLTLTWTGRFQGANATPRAQHLDYLRRQGVAISLTWWTFIYIVVIKEFRGEWERFYQVPYSISCEVVQDLTGDVPKAPAPNFDDLIGGDLVTSNSIANQLGLPAISKALGTLSAAVAAVPSFIGATSPQLAKVMAAITGAQTATLTATNGANLATSAPALVGNIVAGNQPSSNISQLTNQVSNMGQLSNLTQLGASLGRMRQNVTQVAF